MTEAPRPGPAAFACAYLNGRCESVPPLLLALEGLTDVAALMAAAGGALKRGGVMDAEPRVAYTPDGTVVPKTARIGTQLRANAVLILSCGEPFDAPGVPERAKHMHAAYVKQTQRLGPLVRAENRDVLREPETAAEGPEKKQTPWLFSPSGRWKSPLALRPGAQHR